MASGRVSLILDELDEFEARVEEAVDAVGETRLFGARETGGGGSSHTPVVFFRSSVTGVDGRLETRVLVPTHASHFMDRLLNAGLSLFLFYELREFLLERA